MDALLLFQAVGGQRLVPFVEIPAALHVAVLVFDDIAFVETGIGIVGDGVHFADIDTAVAGVAELLDPGSPPGLAVAEDAGGVGVVALEQAGAAGHAGGGGDVAVGEGGALLDEAVEMGCGHIVEAERLDAVEALLVGDDHDNVGTLVAHVPCPVRWCSKRWPSVATVRLWIILIEAFDDLIGAHEPVAGMRLQTVLSMNRILYAYRKQDRVRQ